MLDVFCDSLPGDAVVVEAGAYHGEDTVQLAERVGFVHAFEPVSFNELRTAAGPWQNVECWPYALGSERGEREMWVSGGPHTASSSLLRPTGHLDVLPEICFGTQQGFMTTTLDRWALEYDAGPIDGLWLDLQGMELAVLKAAGSALEAVRAIVLEVSHVELYEGGPLWPEVESWLRSQGFEVKHQVGIGAEQSNVLVTHA